MARSLLLGVNLAGAEFGSNVPGVFGTDYTYPTHAEIDYYASKNLDVIRLPFLWERLQRSEFGSLDAAELSRLDDVVNYATRQRPENRGRAA
jgi:endoglucanase